MWFDPGHAGLFITSTLLYLGEDINSLIVSLHQGKQPPETPAKTFVRSYNQIKSYGPFKSLFRFD